MPAAPPRALRIGNRERCIGVVMIGYGVAVPGFGAWQHIVLLWALMPMSITIIGMPPETCIFFVDLYRTGDRCVRLASSGPEAR